MRGWNGINIEPLPTEYKELVKYRTRDINLQIGISNKEGNTTLFMIGMGSTLLKNYSSHNSPSINITVHSMQNVCNKYIPKNKIIDFCKIDVEGEEKNVLLGYDFKNYRPKVFCIESTIPGTSIPCHNLWEDLLLKNNYSFAYQYDINRYYIDNNKIQLKQRFNKADEIIKNYKKNPIINIFK